MKKIAFIFSIACALQLNAADQLKIIKLDTASQFFEIDSISSLTFTNPGNARLKIIKPDGSSQLIKISDIASVTFEGSSEIEKNEFFKRIGINLLGNYPNPFNPTTTVRFATTNPGIAKVEVFNQNGQLVTTLHNGRLPAGSHSLNWNAQGFATGTYFIKASKDGASVSNRMLLIK